MIIDYNRACRCTARLKNRMSLEWYVLEWDDTSRRWKEFNYRNDWESSQCAIVSVPSHAAMKTNIIALANESEEKNAFEESLWCEWQGKLGGGFTGSRTQFRIPPRQTLTMKSGNEKRSTLVMQSWSRIFRLISVLKSRNKVRGRCRVKNT